MPLRAPINPEGWYHVGSRGCYGRTLFHTTGEHEMFLRMYARVARKYVWDTLAWTLMQNHHHFVIRLYNDGLSNGMRELHGGYSRWLHEVYGQTRQGHLFRHGFFARELLTDAEVLVACSYVDLNSTAAGLCPSPELSEWCGYRATVGIERPREFHSPRALLDLFSPEPAKAQSAYRQFVHDGLALRAETSPNDVT